MRFRGFAGLGGGSATATQKRDAGGPSRLGWGCGAALGIALVGFLPGCDPGEPQGGIEAPVERSAAQRGEEAAAPSEAQVDAPDERAPVAATEPYEARADAAPMAAAAEGEQVPGEVSDPVRGGGASEASSEASARPGAGALSELQVVLGAEGGRVLERGELQGLDPAQVIALRAVREGTRVALAWERERDVAPALAPEVRWRDPVTGTWSEWEPVEVTWREEVAAVARFDLERPAHRLELRGFSGLQRLQIELLVRPGHGDPGRHPEGEVEDMSP